MRKTNNSSRAMSADDLENLDAGSLVEDKDGDVFMVTHGGDFVCLTDVTDSGMTGLALDTYELLTTEPIVPAVYRLERE